jgi:hypothetical protein
MTLRAALGAVIGGNACPGPKSRRRSGPTSNATNCRTPEQANINADEKLKCSAAKADVDVEMTN